MLFWVLVACLVSMVTLAITRPLLRASPGAAQDPDTATAAADIAVYKDQLKEVAADEASGALASAEAENARSEIARRLLRVSGGGDDGLSSADPPATAFAKRAFFATSLLLPVVSLGLYLAYGTPGMPGDPLSARLAKSTMSENPNDLVAKVEERLREHPDDGTGWSVIAPVYYAMGRYADAATAYANAMRLVGESPDRLQGFANARIRQENGVIPEDARTALQRLVEIAPDKKEARIWLALAKEQDGKLADAAADYRKLIEEAPPGAPWRKVLEERLAGLTPGSAAPAQPQGAEQKPASEASAPLPPGPSAVMAMTPEQRQAFITQMIDGLAARLKTDGSDTAGWLKLIRAYQVLGRHDDAVRALSDARSNLKTDRVGLARIDDLARELGLGG